VAFAKQAQSDLRARDALVLSGSDDCHQLHYLQMACEKICKAHLCGSGSDPIDLESSHAYISRTLPLIIRHRLARQSRHDAPQRTWLISAVRALARRIELLAPAVRDGGRAPSNCEYPWEDAKGNVLIPAEFNFELDLLYQRAGVYLLKSLPVIASELANEDA
jgi:hypothetical protein